MVDDVGDLRIIEHSLKRRHGSLIDHAHDVLAMQAVQNRLNLFGRVCILYHVIILERWECAGQTRTRGLMAGSAVS